MNKVIITAIMAFVIFVMYSAYSEHQYQEGVNKFSRILSGLNPSNVEPMDASTICNMAVHYAKDGGSKELQDHYLKGRHEYVGQVVDYHLRNKPMPKDTLEHAGRLARVYWLFYKAQEVSVEKPFWKPNKHVVNDLKRFCDLSRYRK